MLSKMKRISVLWGALLFMVTLVTLYTMLDTINSSPRTGQGQQQYQLLESKISKLESDISANDRIIQEIRSQVGNLVKDKPGGKIFKGSLDTQNKLDNLIKFKIPASRKEEKFEAVALGKVSVSEGQCKWNEQAVSSADINTHELLEKLPFDNPDGGVWKQGWRVEYDPHTWTADNKLKIIVVPHTHCDPGWLKTFQDYYKTQTKSILDNFVPKLEQNSNYKFMYSEMSFFSLWWSEQSIEMKNRVKKLLANGQFEISTGGWVMTDEANAHYYAMLDQLIEGNQWVNNSLGYTPKSGWSIDPFGYSSTMAYLLKRSNFKSMLIQRVHYTIKKHLAKEKSLEFMWRQHWDSEASTDMFTHMMPFYSYDVPHTCGPDPAVCCQFDFKRLPGTGVRCPWKFNPVAINIGNVAERSTTILDQWKKKATLYQSNVVLIPLGDDFRYLNQEEFNQQFGNYEKIFKHLEQHPELGAEAKFGTLSDYFEAVYQSTGTTPGQAPPKTPSLSGDFFSYADRDDHYWTGYFTSRPLQKNLDRAVEHNIRSAEIIYSLALTKARQNSVANFPSKDFMEKMVDARRSLGLFQHHDAITGTAKDFVVIDYGKRLLRALHSTKAVIAECATFLLAKTLTNYKYSESTPFFNMDEVRAQHDSLPTRPILEIGTEPKVVLLYNSLGQPRVEVVELWVSWPYLEVKDDEDHVIHSQIDPLWGANGKVEKEKFKVSFVALMPGLGLKRFTIKKMESGQDTLNHIVTIGLIGEHGTVDGGPFEVKMISSRADFEVKTKYLTSTFSGTSGLLQTVTVLSSGQRFISKLEFIQYGTKMSKERSGAYLFLPDGNAKTLETGDPKNIQILDGPIRSEVHVSTRFIEHHAMMYNTPGTDGMSVELYNIVDIRQSQNKEVGMRIHTNIENKERVFFSDVNGFQIQKRKYHEKLTLQGNVYPMPTMAFMHDETKRLTVMSSQSSGVANLVEGAIDVMLDRRLNQDDNRGLAQGVLDNHPTPSRHRLLFESRTGKVTSLVQESTFPTILAQASSLSLIHPIYTMPESGKAKLIELKSSAPLLKTSLNCETHLLNLRAMQNSDDDPELKNVPKETALLLLRNLPGDCSFPAPSLACSSSKSQVKLGELFTDTKVKKSYHTSLTMTKTLEEISPSSELEVPSMEIVAVKVELA